MERDEEATYAEFERLKRELIEPSLSSHKGRLIKTTGDGALVEFASPLAAVRCAVEMQDHLASGDSLLRFRIGLNLGDVIVGQDGELYGDGINIAVRLEGIADPGGILISEKVLRYVLEGSVRKASGKVRITGQLIDAVTGAHIWADRFERDLTDVFALQDEVTVTVVSVIQPKLLQTEIAMATRRQPENLTAYDFYLRALQRHYLGTSEGVAEAIRLAHRALELEPRFGVVAALAGASHMRNVHLGYAADPQFDRKEAVRLLRLALSIDDSDADILAWGAITSAFMVGDSESEMEMADRAVALNPNSFTAWNSRGYVYKTAGLQEEALRSFERAIRMSPVDPRLHLTFSGMGMALIELGRFDEAIVAGTKAQRQNPIFPGAYRCLASALAHLERDAEAHEAAARVLEFDPAFSISAWIARAPGWGQSGSKVLIEGLRKAGLPE
jgi:adenylate cyclase